MEDMKTVLESNQFSSPSMEQLSHLVPMTYYKGSQMKNEQKSWIIAALRKLCYRNLCLVNWQIPEDYNYKLSTKENYAAKTEAERIIVGPHAEIRKTLDMEYHGWYIPLRQQFQDMLVDSVTRIGTPAKHPWIIFTAGPMGAGKSHTLEWMSKKGFFPLHEVVHLDPDKFKLALPEWDGYVEDDITNAGQLTRKESGLLVEIGQAAAMKNAKHIWMDGSFRDGEWYQKTLDSIRKHHQEYRICILYVHAKREIVLERARKRGETTGRYVPEADIEDSLRRVPETVHRLAYMADFVADIENSGDTPRLIGWSSDYGACRMITCDSFDEISRRFASIPDESERSRDSWKRFIQAMVRTKPILVFGRSYCPQSDKLRARLHEINADFTQVILDGECFGGAKMHSVLTELTGQWTLPMLFIGGHFIGGWDETELLSENQKLVPLVQAAVDAKTLAEATP